MRPILLGLAVMISSCAVSGAMAGERFRVIGDYGYGDRYAFAGEAIGGAYVGAPLTRFPRPNEIVPPAWGYGTYGVPTITGIRQAPAGAPTLTVINSRDAAAAQSGVRMISVTVPRR